jgi:hypothetical protein
MARRGHVVVPQVHGIGAEVGAMEVGLLLVGAAAGMALVELVIRRTDVGAVLVLALLIHSHGFAHIDLSFLVGPIRVSSGDLLLVVLLTAATARALRMERLTLPQRLLVVLLLMVVWGVFRGVAVFGIQAPVNEARRVLRFVATALYFATIEPRRDLLHRLGWIWLAATLALGGVTALRWLGNAVGVSDGFFRGTEGGLRVIHSDGALMIAQGAIIALPLFLDRSRRLARYIVPIALAFVVLLQHRTVWIVTAAGIIYLLHRERALAQRVLTVLTASLAVLAILSFAVFGDDADVADQLADSAQRTNTFEWRVQGWISLVDQAGPRGVEEMITGRPFGNGWDRSLGVGRVVEVSPHNFYLEAFLRVGMAGLLVLLWIYWFALRGTHLADRASPLGTTMLSPGVLHVVVAMQLPYFITYAPDTSQAMLLGLACAVAASRLSDEERVPAVVEVEG